MNKRRLALSALAACLLVALPAIAMAMVVIPDWLVNAVQPMMLFVTPGFFAALALSGNVHDDNRAVAIVVSALFWTAISYGLLSAYANLRSHRHTPEG